MVVHSHARLEVVFEILLIVCSPFNITICVSARLPPLSIDEITPSRATSLRRKEEGEGEWRLRHSRYRSASRCGDECSAILHAKHLNEEKEKGKKNETHRA